MTPLTALDVLFSDVVCVRADQHPSRQPPYVSYYAVFDGKGESEAPPTFIGLVGGTLAARFPTRIFADLLSDVLPATVGGSASLEEVRLRLDRCHGEALAAVDEDGAFLGVVCRRGLLEALLKQEHDLLDSAQYQRVLVEEELDRLKQWSSQLERLHQASKHLLNVIGHTLVESDILSGAIEALAKLLGARYGAVGVLAKDGTLAQFVTYGMSEAEVARMVRWPEGKGLLGTVIRENTVLRLADLSRDPRAAGFPEGHPPMRSLLALPLSRHGRAFGNVYLCEKEGGEAFSADDEALASGFGQALSLALENVWEMEEIRRTQERVAYLSNYDALTGLPNRLLFNDRATQALMAARRGDYRLALLVLDIDHFKLINETLGHNHGDRLLKQIAERLSRTLREDDTAARLSGDEFLVLLPKVVNIADVGHVAQKLLDALVEPFALPNRQYFLTGSLGVALYPTDGATIDTLMKNADAALFAAKGRGRNHFQFYKLEMNERLIERMTLEDKLRNALERGELSLHYQPQICLKSGRVVALEALLRWQSAEFGAVPPVRFIPVAEDSGLILPIGEWVLREACRQNKAWQDEGLPAVPIAVNLSAKQFSQENLAVQIFDILRDSGLGGQFLELELTESLTMENPSRTLAFLTELKQLGVGVLIDDFGTGYSNLSYLKRFPVDKIKLDKSFVHDIARSGNDLAIAKAVILLGHSLGLSVLAEGVETREQLGVLLEQGCDELQGYYYCRPLDAESASAWLRRPPPLAR